MQMSPRIFFYFLFLLLSVSCTNTQPMRRINRYTDTHQTGIELSGAQNNQTDFGSIVIVMQLGFIERAMARTLSRSCYLVDGIAEAYSVKSDAHKMYRLAGNLCRNHKAMENLTKNRQQKRTKKMDKIDKIIEKKKCSCPKVNVRLRHRNSLIRC